LPVPVLAKHDMGCKYARASDDLTVDDEGNILTGSIQGGHSEAAKRISDTYNLHKAAGAIPGWWIAVSLATGESDGDAYPDKATAVWHQNNSEAWFAFIRISPASMSVCEAESQLRWHRQAARLRLNDREYKRGGMDMIPRLTTEGARNQLLAARQVIDQPIAFGYAK
jgi:hypothetical protein